MTIDPNPTTLHPPLNGTKTHPLTPHARGVLRELAMAPMLRQNMNAGVADRFERGGLAEQVMLPSPFQIHRGKPIRYMQITDAGRKVIDNG